MQLPDFTFEHLKKLPLRAIVAFAARCARRVEHLAQLPAGHPQGEGRRMAVEAALRMAEAFARGSDAPPDEVVFAALHATRGVAGEPAGSQATTAAAEAAHAMASAWHLAAPRDADVHEPFELRTPEARAFLGRLATATAELAALEAFTAAEEAFTAVGYHNEDFVGAARNDYDKLLRLRLGRYPEAGEPIDSSPSGPLGPL